MRKPKSWYDKQGFPKEFSHQVEMGEDCKSVYDMLVSEARKFVPKGDVFYILKHPESKSAAWYYVKGLPKGNLYEGTLCGPDGIVSKILND